MSADTLIEGGTDIESTVMEFTLTDLPGQTEPRVLKAYGWTRMRRGPAQREGAVWRVGLTMEAMPHHGVDGVLGAFTVDVDPKKTTQGVVLLSADPVSGQPRLDPQYPGSGYIDVNFEIRAKVMGMDIFAGPEVPFRVVNTAIDGFFPATAYSHAAMLAALKLTAAGSPIAAAAKIVAGTHRKLDGGDSTGGLDSCACETCCRVEAAGHCGCLTLERTDEVLIYQARPGGPTVWITVRNSGPAAMRVTWDGELPGGHSADPGRSVVIEPGNTVTAACAVSLLVTVEPGVSARAEGDYVISTCCPGRAR
jgi:hypothetical protein